MPVAGAEQAARQVYSEETHHWGRSSAILVSPDLISDFEIAIRSDRLVEFLRQLKLLEIDNPKKLPPRCVIVLDYTDDQPKNAYLSMRYVGFFYKHIISQLRLTQQEFDACSRIFGVR